jgi:DNA repair exonuclease SbcCD ATPase subunit
VRLHRIHLRNYRGVIDREVVFADAGITIVEGPNEAGKSSLAEALTLIFDEPDSSAKSLVRAVKPTNADEGAEVEVDLTTGPYRLRYAKRWNKRHMTTLTVESPRREQLTGRSAHDRVRAILDETLDWGLWKALRVEQSAPLTQASLAANRSLAAALDVAAGGGVSGAAENLYQRIESEFLTYFTRLGRPTSEYKTSIEELGSAQTIFQQARAAIDAVDADAEAHAAVLNEVSTLKEQAQSHANVLQQLEQQWNDAREHQRQLAELATLFERAREQLDMAKRDLDARSQLANEHATRKADLDVRIAEGETLAPAVAAAEKRASDAATEYDVAQRAAQGAAEVARIAAEDEAYYRDLFDLQTMRERQERAVAAFNQLEEAEHTLAVCVVDDDRLQKLEDAHLQVVQANAVLSAESARLSIEALEETDVVVDGEPRTLIRGHSEDIAITQPVEFVIPNSIRLRVTPGIGEQERAETLNRAETEFRSLCEQARVADIRAARERNAERREATQSQKDARKTLAASLRDLTLEQLGQLIVSLAARTADYQQKRPSHPPFPPDVQTAEDAATLAKRDAVAAGERAKHAETEHLRLRDAAASARNEAVARATKFEAAQQEFERTEKLLSEARLGVPDEVLEQRYQAARDSSDQARAKWEAQEKYVASLDPEGVQIQVTNAQKLRDRFQTDLREREDRTLRIEERISVAGGRGLQDDCDRAASALDAAQRRNESNTRRADAARLLFETMQHHRDAAKRTYVAPFREHVERLGRIVFGPDFSVEIDDELQVVRRTLNGITVTWEDLSAGAKEQLCIIGRLACATLVSPDEGVPVIVDDALGHSDPQRLQRVGAVFNSAGSKAQVIILTCMPDRYRSIGSAHVVTLPTEHPAGDGGSPSGAGC